MKQCTLNTARLFLVCIESQLTLRFELGRNPLYHKIIKALLYHWFRLGTLNPFLSYSTRRTWSQKVFSCTIIRHGLHLSTKFWVSYLISKVLTYQIKSTYTFKKEVIMYYKTVSYKPMVY